MEKLGVYNFRSLSNVEPVDIKPITVLVGKNSSGKSSFIRILPLIKQSIKSKISDPLLWYGDYVDFGEFENCLSKGKDAKTDQLEFFIDIIVKTIAFDEVDVPIQLIISICDNSFKTVNIRYFDQEIIIKYSDNDTIKNVIINGSNFLDSLVTYVNDRDDHSLIPLVKFKEDKHPLELLTNPIKSNDLTTIEKELNKWANENENYLTKKGQTFLSTLFKKIFTTSKHDLLNFFIENGFFKTDLDHISIFEKLNNLMIANCLSTIIRTINVGIAKEIWGFKYVKPIRAKAERYYRLQGLNTDDLDPDGSNLPILLNSFEPEKRIQFENWVKEKFGFSFTIATSTSHISLIFKDSDTKEEFNMADVGYGYSQILPILLQLWLILFDSKNPLDDNITLIIEQPELHLHPAFQAKIIDVFVEMLEEANKLNKQLKIIFETHSETMIQRLGYLIAKGYLIDNQVNILVFEKENNETTISSKKFDSDGILEEWPIGFFTPAKKEKK